jgi:hypothetical protein
LVNFSKKMPHVEIGGISQIYTFIDEILKYAIFIFPTLLGFWLIHFYIGQMCQMGQNAFEGTTSITLH